MRVLDVEGIFWPAANPDDRTAGRLTFDVSAGARLELIGSFGSLDEIFAEHDGPLRILGIGGKRLLTLDDCMKAGSTLETPGIYSERYRPAIILSGAHFDAGEELSFSAIAVQLRHLSHWIERSGVVVEMTEDAAAHAITEIRLTHTPIGKATTATELGQLELGFTWRLRGDHVVESTIEQGSYLRLQPAEVLSLDELVKVCMALQHLVTLGVDASAPITSVSLWHPEVTHTLPSGHIVNDTIDMYAQLQGGDVPSDDRHRLSHEMLFTFSDLGGIAGVARWLEVASKFEPVVGALMSHRYMPRMYGENRLQNAVFAAETFDRLRFPNRLQSKSEFRRRIAEVVRGVPKEHKSWLREQLQYSNEPRLKQRLLRLASHAGVTFEALVRDVDRWSDLVKDARNRSVHRTRQREVTDGPSLHLLSESAYFLVALCLLRECGASDATLAKIQQHQRFIWLGGRLAEL